MTGNRVLAALLLFFAVNVPAAARCGTIETLVDNASTARVYFGLPALRDSLVSRIAALAAGNPDTLLDLLDTPWATRFDLIRRALLEDPERARQALIARLGKVGDSRAALPLLNVFRELGRSGDEAALDPSLESGDPSLRVLACRCLARFGAAKRAWSQLAPLLSSESAHVRLAAARASGEIARREPEADYPAEIPRRLKALLLDPSPRVRFTAHESLELIEPGSARPPAPLYPER